MPILSLAALTILDAGPAGQVQAAAAAGFTHVGLRLMPLLPTDQTVVGIPDRERELTAVLAATGLKVLEIGVFPIKPSMDWPLVEQVVAFSAGLGARFTICPVEDRDPVRAAQSFARLAAMSTRHAMTTCLEFNPYSACPSLAAALALLDASGATDAGLCLDVLHLSRSGGSPADLTPAVLPHVRIVHLCDAAPPPRPGTRSIDELRAESRTARLLPGEGALWLADLLHRLPPTVPLSLEAPTAADAGEPPSARATRAFQVTTAWLAAAGCG